MRNKHSEYGTDPMLFARVARAAFAALAVAAAYDVFANCCPSSDARVWGPHAWTIAYHLAHQAEARGWSGERFSRVMDALAITLPCSTCRQHYAKALVDPAGMSPTELVYARQSRIAALPGSKATPWPGPMDREAAKMGFGRAWRMYKCCAAGMPLRPLSTFIDRLAYGSAASES